eukprot:gene27138-30679_t
MARELPRNPGFPRTSHTGPRIRNMGTTVCVRRRKPLTSRPGHHAPPHEHDSMSTESSSHSPSQPIRFFHRGQVVDVSGVHPTRSVLDWLREDARCTGTKEGCNEGDCGACTVVIGELAEAGAPDAVGGLRLQTVNACIQFLPTLNGKALFTVEDLKDQCQASQAAPAPALQEGDKRPHPVHCLHPVQQALVDCHGSQCGFCTPGFVMSLWSAYEHHQARGTQPSRQQLADDLSGNLCRCTGYRPILDGSISH